MMKDIYICQDGYSSYLTTELNSYNYKTIEQASVYSLVERLRGNPPVDAVFPHYAVLDVEFVESAGVNGIAGAIFDIFTAGIKDKRVEDRIDCRFLSPSNVKSLGSRVSSVKKAFAELLKKRMSRVYKLVDFDADITKPNSDVSLNVYFTDFDKAAVGNGFISYGQKRVADDSSAPSRSYLKIEEAYTILGIYPAENDLVADLGAAPGGWSYSAAKRGATVYAIDNGPLKGGAKDNPNIIHRREDAFKFRDRSIERFDWLYCDMVEEPHHSFKLLQSWVESRYCRKFVVNLKFGRVNPNTLLAEIRSNSGFIKSCESLKIRHLNHDREEFTLMGVLL